MGPKPSAQAAARQLHRTLARFQALPLEVSAPPLKGFEGDAWALEVPPFSHAAAEIITWVSQVRDLHPDVIVFSASLAEDIHTCEIWFPKTVALASHNSADLMFNTELGLVTLDIGSQVMSMYVDPDARLSLTQWFARFTGDPVINGRLSGLRVTQRAHALEILLPAVTSRETDPMVRL